MAGAVIGWITLGGAILLRLTVAMAGRARGGFGARFSGERNSAPFLHGFGLSIAAPVRPLRDLRKFDSKVVVHGDSQLLFAAAQSFASKRARAFSSSFEILSLTTASFDRALIVRERSSLRRYSRVILATS